MIANQPKQLQRQRPPPPPTTPRLSQNINHIPSTPVEISEKSLAAVANIVINQLRKDRQDELEISTIDVSIFRNEMDVSTMSLHIEDQNEE